MSMQTVKRGWETGLSSEVAYLVKELKSTGMTDVVVDCGAGVGRHSFYALNEGIKRVTAIEKDPEQAAIIRDEADKRKTSNLTVVEGDVLEELGKVEENSIDGIIDCGMSHCLEEDDKKEHFSSLVHSRLKPGGLYSLTHFSENERFARGGAPLEKLQALYPPDQWELVMPWEEASWPRKEGGGKESEKHFAYKVVLKKK